MKCYSIPKRLLHIVFGGSAIWLGTTFCSPLAAYDFELPPTTASAPDALASPENATPPSIVPAASLEDVSHWDNGPILEDELYNNDYACEDEYCDEYAYDGYNSDIGLEDESSSVECEDTDGLVDTPEESVYSDFEDSWDDFGYDYGEMYVHDEQAVADEDDSEDYTYEWEDEYCHGEDWATGCDEGSGDADTQEESVCSDFDSYDDFGYDYGEMYASNDQTVVDEEVQDNSEDYTYDWEDEYCHGEDWMTGCDEASGEAEEAEQTEDDSYAYAEEHYEDYWYDDEYVYDYEDETGCDDSESVSGAEEPEEVTSTVAADDADSSEEDDFSYEFDDYEMYYGYEADNAEVAEDVAAIEDEIAEDAAEPDESDWEDYYYGDEYLYENDSEQVAEEAEADETVEVEASVEASVEEAWADEYEYDTYEYDYYDYDYGMENASDAQAATDESADVRDESYDHVDPMDHYGYEYEVPNDWMETEVDEPSGVELDLFAWRPNELLGDADCSLIRSIELLSDRGAAERRTRLNNYIEALGFEAIDFAYRYEDATDSDVLTLADDLPGMAAFLASYRLVEEGQIGMDDAVLLLESALSGLSLDWIEDVSHIAEPKETVSTSHPVVVAMASAATLSIATVTDLAATISQQLADLPWSELQGRLDEIRSAFRPLGADNTFMF